MAGGVRKRCASREAGRGRGQGAVLRGGYYRCAAVSMSARGGRDSRGFSTETHLVTAEGWPSEPDCRHRSGDAVSQGRWERQGTLPELLPPPVALFTRHTTGDYCSEVRHCVSRWRDIMDPGKPDTVRAPTLGQLVGTREREDKYISRRAEARGHGPECVVGMVGAGQPAKARRRGRGEHEDPEGAGCELDVQSRQRQSGKGIPAGRSSRGRDMEGN